MILKYVYDPLYSVYDLLYAMSIVFAYRVLFDHYMIIVTTICNYMITVASVFDPNDYISSSV